MEKTKSTTKKATTNLEAKVYSQKGATLESINLPANIFGLKWNADLVHEVVTSMMSNARAGTAHTKDRGEVSGGGKKPWKQKGTGRSRHGSSRSPIWVGGGITFGPRNDKDYSKKINKKTRVKALFTLLSNKLSKDSLAFVDTISLKEIKTKEASSVLLKLAPNFSSKKFILAIPERDATIEKSFANLPNIETILVTELNPVLLANNKAVIFVNPAKSLSILEAKMK